MALDYTQSATFAPLVWLLAKLTFCVAVYPLAFAAWGAPGDPPISSLVARAAWGLAALAEGTCDEAVFERCGMLAELWHQTASGGNSDLVRDLLAVALLKHAMRPSSLEPSRTLDIIAHCTLLAWALVAAAHTAAMQHGARAVTVAVVCMCAAAVLAAAVCVSPFLARGLGALASSHLALRACLYTGAVAMRLYCTPRDAHAAPRKKVPHPQLPSAVIVGWLFFAPSTPALCVLAAAHACLLRAAQPPAPPAYAVGEQQCPEHPPEPPAPEPPALSEDTLRRMHDMEAALDSARIRPASRA